MALLSDLPEVLLLLIFRELGDLDDVVHLARTCRRLHVILECGRLNDHFIITELGQRSGKIIYKTDRLTELSEDNKELAELAKREYGCRLPISASLDREGLARS